MAKRPSNDGASWSSSELKTLKSLAKEGTPTGQVAKKLGRTAEAKDAFERAVEAARTSPPHRRRYTSAWGRQAKSELKTLS